LLSFSLTGKKDIPQEPSHPRLPFHKNVDFIAVSVYNETIMGKIFYIMGKSASGKDKICTRMLESPELHLKSLVLYTTRPIRSGETDGQQYHFVGQEELCRLRNEGKIIEERTYDTARGLWTYFTADDAIELANENYIAIGTLVSYGKLRGYYGQDKLVPVYIDVGDEQLMERAMKREKKQEHPNYKELCRRFLADSEDFSEEKIREAGITRRFANNGDIEKCMSEIKTFIGGMIHG